MSLNALRLSIADQLCKIEDMLPSSYCLTLVARNVDKVNADIILTVDDLPKVVEAIQAIESDPKGKTIKAGEL